MVRAPDYYHVRAYICSTTCPVIRSFEFALADGALLATRGAQPLRGSYTERFWRLNEEVRAARGSQEHWARILVLFDVKSSISGFAEDQIYITSTKQQARIGIYIATCAANPNFVEIIPNRFSNSSLATQPNRKVAVNASRKSILPPSAYGFLSPCNSCYRMPLSCLPQALENIQRCARDETDYINPWTGVRFTGWRPHVEHGNEFLAPTENSQHFSSYQGVLEVWRGCLVARIRDAIDLDFELVNLQPQLADFKFLTSGLYKRTQRRQLFVQYKIDGLYRSPASPLTKVAIGRNQRGSQIRYYFTDYERFDYFFYQFDFVDQQKRAWTNFFFLPERVIPDEFYTTSSKEGDFSGDTFKPYWIAMDSDGAWVKAVYEIIQRTPEPRLPGKRPHRPLGKSSQPDTRMNASTIRQPSLLQTEVFFGNVFFTVMDQCAARRSGLVIVLSAVHPMGDLAYCRYNWTKQEQEAFIMHKKVPCTITELPRETAVVPFFLYTRKRESTSRGPTLSTSELQRLNICPQGRLLIFDVFGQDGSGMYSPLLVVPSDDIRPTADHFAIYDSNSGKNKHEEFEERVPLLAELLQSGMSPIDYAISTTGPNVFESGPDAWTELWTLLNRLTGLEEFAIPKHSSIRHFKEIGNDEDSDDES
ncbi:hypothetical protein PSV08DRAFT_190909 [Bipolaris maydis]|uniref:uncharacterized protein n=1 Tax=Cochliobolus heterostrophus TaxID=5016 RepID=UPI0024D23006|nr:hypothetical protein J3E73DRAFT_185466 [Bipolaris maydis]KAJ6265606.1 hypothetical protein PSV08DRAFT_190909 [Bipolaris maydis]KAJ6283437.1 hypothetical protein J3E71DRAFT_172607 [Bipolaris maydis]